MLKGRPDVMALVAVIAAVAVVALAAPAPDGTVRTVDWKAVAASGRVETRPDDVAPWLALRRGDRVHATSVVRTGTRSHATLVRGATIVLLDPQSQVVLPSAESSTGPSSVFQSSGSVIYQVEGVRGTGFRVETPYLVAGVKGTEFLVSVHDGRASVTVREGEVEVTTARSDERQLVGAGETIVVHEAASKGGVERVDRRGVSPDGKAAAGEVKHLAWKQSRRLDEARREVSFLIDPRARRAAQEVEVAATSELVEPAAAGDPVLQDQRERTLEPVVEKADELIEDLANDPLRQDDGSKLATPPPAPSP
jgi:FecR protein